MAVVKNALSVNTGVGGNKQVNFSFSNVGIGFADKGRVDQGKWVFFNSNGSETTQGTLFDAGNDFTAWDQQVSSSSGSLAVRIYSLPTQDYNPSRTGTVALTVIGNGIGLGTFNLLYPNVTIPAGTYRDFYIGSYTSEEFNSFAKFHLFTATNLGSRVSEYFLHDWSDTVETSDNLPIQHSKFMFEDIPIREFFRQNPWKIPVEKIPITERIEYITLRHGTITDWNFMPNYKIMFQGTNEIGTFGTTNWDINLQSFGRISKSIKHWTGDFEVGEWNPTFADPDNELFGSLYATVLESRFKEMQLSAMISDSPLTYIPQFGGYLEETEWRDGKTTWLLRDKIKDIPNRTFVFDYENIGTIQKNGRQIGIVKKIVGTDVMFDDDGDVSYIHYKTGGGAKLSAAGVLTTAAAGAIKGGWVGAAIGAGIGILKGLFGGSDEHEVGYWQLTDFNVIPDGVVKSGAKMKFFAGSISGIATNSYGPLFNIREFSVNSGTFRNTIFGFNGTVAFDNTDGINVGDYIYVRKPMLFAGNPAEIIKALLCGSNIDFPYYAGTAKTSSGFFGNLSPDIPNDFATNFDTELNSMSSFQLSKIISITDNTSPFDEVKQLVRELQISFYINESNDFAVKCIRPRQLISSGTETHYREGVNILDGFQWKRSTQEALAGARIYYAYAGEANGAFLNSYNKFLEKKSANPIPGANLWATLESKWIKYDEDARAVLYRTLIAQEKGLDRITLPTTLYGIIHSITDAIQVTHRTGSLGTQLFELESYEKDFDTSRVTLTAVNLSRMFGYGNCLWTGTSIYVSNGTQSGWNTMGAINIPTIIGSLIGTLNSFDLTFEPDDLALQTQSTLINLGPRLLAFGSLSNRYCELVAFEGYSQVEGLYALRYHLKRGLFNTIPRTYFNNESIYDFGPLQIGENGSYLQPSISSFGTFNFGTSHGIATNIGSVFKFW